MPLLALQAMPCGCVAGVYGVSPSVVEIEVVEAKGPHCLFSRHRIGCISRLGVTESFMALPGTPPG